jgi:hypothetical protein
MCASQVWLIWPFLMWGALIAVGYGVGYSLLGLVNEPMCLFNSVNWIASNFKYNIYLVQVRAWWQHPVQRAGKAGSKS